jgi:predicted TIM-barrel fold metal-dependent hydrolase
MPIPRRTFVATAATTPLLAAAASTGRADEPARRIPVVDTHLHCFAGRDDKRFPYHERAPYRPEEASPPEHLLRCMEGAGVDYAIVVHPEPYQDDHRDLDTASESAKAS